MKKVVRAMIGDCIQRLRIAPTESTADDILKQVHDHISNARQLFVMKKYDLEKLHTLGSAHIKPLVHFSMAPKAADILQQHLQEHSVL